jgi:hypothetical protein
LVAVTTQTIYVPVNHTVYVNRTIYVNYTKYIYVNKTTPVYINRTVYVPTSLNESLSAYLNDLFGWGGLKCWIVTFVYDNATPFYYEGNATGSMATIGVMIIPRQLLSKFNETLPYEVGSTRYYPYGILQLNSFPLTRIYAIGGSINITELWIITGEAVVPKNTSVPAVYIFGDVTARLGPLPHFYYAVINNTGGYIVVEYPATVGIEYTVMHYNRTYTVLFFPIAEKIQPGGPTIVSTQLANPFACNWTIIGPVDPNAVMSYPLPYAWTFAEIAAAFYGNQTIANVEWLYRYETFSYWVWGKVTPAINASLPYSTS